MLLMTGHIIMYVLSFLIFAFMLWFYLKIRIKELIRIFSGIGIFRSMVLCFIFICGIVLLVKIKSGWVVPVFFALCLGSYHNLRKDKYFLQCNMSDVKSLFLKEYFILGSPFILSELMNGYWLYASAMVLFVLLVPFSKKIRFRIRPLRLFFLYKGSLEYIGMFRRYWPVYLLLILFSVLGLLHDNPRILKVCMMLWGIVQSNAYYDETSVYTVLKYKDYKTLQTVLWKSNVWNVAVLYVPFALLVSIGSCNAEDVVFLAGCILASVLYLLCTGLMSFVSGNRLLYIFLRVGIFLLVFISSCFIPLFNVIFITFILIFSYMLYHKYKAIWNC